MGQNEKETNGERQTTALFIIVWVANLSNYAFLARKQKVRNNFQSEQRNKKSENRNLMEQKGRLMENN